MKARLLAELRSPGRLVSSSDLLAVLGCQRAALDAAVDDLRAHGYDIDFQSNAYQLRFSPEVPWPWEFPGRQDRIHYYPRLDSTMAVARELAESNCPAGTVVIAGVQTQGRGRLDRTWQSDSGGLYLTMVTRPPLAPTDGYKINFLASLALVDVLRALFDLAVSVKWPNDILAQERKLAGMLSEMGAAGDQLHYVNVGIGLNVNNDPGDRAPGAISLKTLTGRPASVKLILARFLDAFEDQLAVADMATVIGRWKSYSSSLNRPVRVVTRSAVVEGMAEAVDAEGALWIRLADGRCRRVVYGDCFYQ